MDYFHCQSMKISRETCLEFYLGLLNLLSGKLHSKLIDKNLSIKEYKRLGSLVNNW